MSDRRQRLLGNPIGAVSFGEVLGWWRKRAHEKHEVQVSWMRDPTAPVARWRAFIDVDSVRWELLAYNDGYWLVDPPATANARVAQGHEKNAEAAKARCLLVWKALSTRLP